MAFNLAIFKTRALTAVIFALVMLAGLLVAGWCFVSLFIIIHFGCWLEFKKLMRKIRPGLHVYIFLGGVFYITIPVITMLLLGFPGMQTYFNSSISHDTRGYSYVLPCMVIFSIWVNDTMAYIVGSFIGRTPFSKISPKKTWEGTVGGAILCVAVMSFLGRGWGIYPVQTWFAISLICAIVGTLGDLLESKLKRLAGVKDSGSILPGHGGFLDRFDSLLVATPFAWLYVYFIMK